MPVNVVLIQSQTGTVKKTTRRKLQTSILFLLLFFFNLVGLGFDSGLHACKAALYCLSHNLSPFQSGYFRDGGLINYLPRLALSYDPPDLTLLTG
jgi:hypothetical protein